MEDDACSVCLEDKREPDGISVLRCGHTFHLPCIDAWCDPESESRGVCPQCRSPIVLPPTGRDGLPRTSAVVDAFVLQLVARLRSYLRRYRRPCALCSNDVLDDPDQSNRLIEFLFEYCSEFCRDCTRRDANGMGRFVDSMKRVSRYNACMFLLSAAEDEDSPIRDRELFLELKARLLRDLEERLERLGEGVPGDAPSDPEEESPPTTEDEPQSSPDSEEDVPPRSPNRDASDDDSVD